MCRKNGDKNYFTSSEGYYLTDCLPYLKKNSVPYYPSYENGGGLNALAKEWEILPDMPNGNGNIKKYSSKQMYRFVKLLTEKLTKEKRQVMSKISKKELLPLEQLSKEQSNDVTDDVPIPVTKDLLFEARVEFIDEVIKALEKYKDTLGGYVYGR